MPPRMRRVSRAESRLPLAICKLLPASAMQSPKARSVPTTCAAVSEERPSRTIVPRAPAPDEEKPTSAPMGNMSAAMVRDRAGFSVVILKGRGDDDDAKDGVEHGVVAGGRKVPEEERAENDAGETAEQHDSEDAIDDLAPQHLQRNDDGLDDNGVGERSAYADHNRHMQK
jgi:hypothetical protein